MALGGTVRGAPLETGAAGSNLTVDWPPARPRIVPSSKESIMSDPQRREFLAAAAGITSLATLAGA